jgi:oligopeptidase B
MTREAPHAPLHPTDVESPFGTRSDPYYWMRDDARADPGVLAYLGAENAYCDAVLGPLKPLEQRLYAEMIGRLKQDDSTVPSLENGYWYYTRYETGREYAVYARRGPRPDAPEEVLVDANREAEGRDYYEVGNLEVSPDNRILAWAEDTVGRRQYTVRFRDLAGGASYADRLENVEPDLAWADDCRTLLYVAKDPETLLGYRVMRHVLGTPAESDTLVYEEADPSFYLGVYRAKTGRFLYIVLQSTVSSEYRYALAADAALGFRIALPRERDHEYQLDDIGERFVLRTNFEAPNFRIVSVPFAAIADRSAWRDEIPARPDAFVAGFDAFRDYLAVAERSQGLRKLRVRSWDGAREFLIDADEPAYTMALGANEEVDTTTLRYVYSSLTTPNTTYDYDMASGARVLLKRDPVLGGFDPARYATEFVYAPARDGARVPVSLLYRKGVARDGTAPLYQYAYGAYGLSQDPAFRSTIFSLVDRGFVFALAHVRGGQELGRAWYDAGRLLHKKNSFTDFIDVTRFLVRERYVDGARVCAMGGSAGGLLIGAVANLAPAEYRALAAHVPFVDIVTTMLDESIPLTTNEYDEWGNPAADRAVYEYMLSYSPYDNVARQDYPALLVTTGFHDSQVQYWEPAKWVARLRALKTDDRTLVFRTNLDAGHGGRSGRFERYHEIAEEFAFLLDQVGLAGPSTQENTSMKLYYSPGACSLASHIALRELGLPFEAIAVDLRKKTTQSGADFNAVNPKGYVPVLELDSGAILTEGTAILQYLADQRPAAGLAPANGTLERYRLQEWLGFINSEIHKSFGPLFDPTAPDAVKDAARQRIARRLGYTEQALAGRDYLLGAQFSVADAYLYTVLNWTGFAAIDLGQWPGLKAYHARVAARPAVQAAQAAEKGR